ncbi:parkin coregulated gene protein homolog isoform X2 [Centruroides sculpturatus]|uniref:parkin coregulated gene protein homolog isoform X2 n=1 Tax=Centruroides sculpturatus TaxID=218467 RepID=UPI000C6EAE91|nr:parkin coregulated gene protein homolog isoform X2 [Centruroides sculpturatus]
MPFDFRNKGQQFPEQNSLQKRIADPPIRIVPAFTKQSNYQKNTKVTGPSKLGFFRPKPASPSQLRIWYESVGLPVFLKHERSGHSLQWKVNIKDLDYKIYLPIFFDGLSELEHPYDFFAVNGIIDMVNANGEKALEVLSFVIPPIKKALKTRYPKVVINTMKAIQQLALCHDLMGVALIPYYHSILPPLNFFLEYNINIGDEIHYGQRKRNVIGDLVKETLEIFEKTGGPQAFSRIKRYVLTYESHVHNT